MSAENVERVRETYRLLRRGDPRVLPELIAPDATWEPAAESKRRPSVNGAEVAERLLWRATVHRFRASELIDLGDRVLVAVAGRRMQYLGASWWRGRIFQLVTIRDGRIARIEDFRMREQALEAAGISS